MARLWSVVRTTSCWNRMACMRDCITNSFHKSSKKRWLYNRHSHSQSSVRQLFLQCTQVAVLLTQCCNITRPCLTLAKLLVQSTHLCQVLAGFLVFLTTSLGDQSFGKLSIQLDCLTRSRFFGGPGDLKGDIAVPVITIAISVGVAVDILLRDPFQQLQGFVDFAFIQGDLDQERGVAGLLQESEQLQSKGLPATKLPGEIA